MSAFQLKATRTNFRQFISKPQLIGICFRCMLVLDTHFVVNSIVFKNYFYVSKTNLVLLWGSYYGTGKKTIIYQSFPSKIFISKSLPKKLKSGKNQIGEYQLFGAKNLLEGLYNNDIKFHRTRYRHYRLKTEKMHYRQKRIIMTSASNLLLQLRLYTKNHTI